LDFIEENNKNGEGTKIVKEKIIVKIESEQIQKHKKE